MCGENIPEAKEEGANTDGDDEEVEEDDQLGVVALARHVGGTLQPGRRHIQAQRHLCYTRGWESHKLREREGRPYTFWGSRSLLFSVEDPCHFGAVHLINGSGSGSDFFLQ